MRLCGSPTPCRRKNTHTLPPAVASRVLLPAAIPAAAAPTATTREGMRVGLEEGRMLGLQKGFEIGACAIALLGGSSGERWM